MIEWLIYHFKIYLHGSLSNSPGTDAESGFACNNLHACAELVIWDACIQSFAVIKDSFPSKISTKWSNSFL